MLNIPSQKSKRFELLLLLFYLTSCNKYNLTQLSAKCNVKHLMLLFIFLIFAMNPNLLNANEKKKQVE